MEITIKIKTERKINLPVYATEGSSGMDLKSAEALVISPGKRACVATGLYIEMPLGVEAQIRPRSGLALKHGITVLNTPGTIDSDYRGEIKIILANFGDDDFKIEIGDRIAQIVFATVTRVKLETTDSLNDTERSVGGFGSTGKK